MGRQLGEHSFTHVIRCVYTETAVSPQFVYARHLMLMRL